LKHIQCIQDINIIQKPLKQFKNSIRKRYRAIERERELEREREGRAKTESKGEGTK